MAWFPPINRISTLWSGAEEPSGTTVRKVAPETIGIVPALLNEITEYWFANRQESSIPDWDRFSPHTHTKFLPQIVLWEIQGDDYFARVTGETVSDLFPVKIANRRLNEVIVDLLAFLPTELDQSVMNSAPIYADRRNAWVLGDEFVHYQAVHLPFRANDQQANRVLSVMAFSTEPKIDV